MAKHYDVVVLGGGLGALSTAALLARRSWRVLLLGHGFRPATYAYEGLPLARRAFTFLASSSPAWSRVLVELAQSQLFRRFGRPLDPMLQVLGQRLRLSLPPDSALLGREVDREFPEVRRVVDELYAELGQSNGLFDAAFERDVVWPPGSFWERRETARVAATLPYLGPGARDVLAELPLDHPYRTVVEASARFASDLASELPPFALARLHGAWTRGVTELAHGEADLVDFLVERVRAHGGDAKLGSRATHVVTKGGRVTGVRVDGDDDVTGIQFLVTDQSSSELQGLAKEFRPSRRALDARPRLEAGLQRFVTSLLVHDDGVPVPLGTESLLLPVPGSSLPLVHLQRAAVPNPTPGTTLLVAEALVGPGEAHDPRDLRRTRAAILLAVEAALPFVERRYLLVDSPHDGLPLWDYRSGKRVLVDRAGLRALGGTLEAEPMVPLYRDENARDENGRDHAGAARTGLASMEGEPLRYPLNGVFGVGRSILPALGQEGELLAAWSVARTITRTDRRKEKMRREMWSKVELG